MGVLGNIFQILGYLRVFLRFFFGGLSGGCGGDGGVAGRSIDGPGGGVGDRSLEGPGCSLLSPAQGLHGR